MKIAIYTNSLDNGGISKFAYNLHDAFNKSHINSGIITFEADTIYGDNITLYRCSSHLKRVSLLRKYIINNDIDAIISNTWFEALIAKLSTFTIRKKVKVISVVHIRPNLWGFSKNDIIRRNLAKLSLNLCHKVVAVSNELKDAMIGEGWVENSKISTIYNPVIFDKVIENKECFKDIENKEKVEIAVIGWIQPRKAQDIILKAFNLVKTKRYTLNFIGGVDDPLYNEEVLELIEKFNLKDNIKLWGPRKDVFEILKNMDVLITASRGEALPTVMIEALYCETPIISSDCDYGPKEILENGKYGLLFKVDDYEGLADCFNKLINDNDLYNEFLALSKRRSKIFTFDKSIKCYMEILS